MRKYVLFFVLIVVFIKHNVVAQEIKNTINLQASLGINNKIITSNETALNYYKQKLMPGISGEVSLQYEIAKRITLKSGIFYLINRKEEEFTYTYLQPEFTPVRKISEIDEHIIGIPLNIGYIMLNNKKVNFSAEGGISICKTLLLKEYSKATYLDGSIKERKVFHDIPFILDNYLNFQLNLTYNISEKITLAFLSSMMYNLEKNEIENYFFLKNSFGIIYKIK